MNKKTLISSILLLSVLLFSCNQEDNSSSNLSQKEILISSDSKTVIQKNAAVRPIYQNGCVAKYGSLCIMILEALNKPVEFDREFVRVSDEFKNKYINEKLSEVILNLEKEELKTFKDKLEFNSKGQLVSFDLDLLRKGTPKTLKSVLSEISVSLGGSSDNIYIIENEEETLIL